MSLWGLLGVSCGRWGGSCPLFGLSWEPRVASWASLGTSWGPLWPLGALLGASCDLLGLSWASLGTFLGALGALLGPLVPSWVSLGVSWGPSADKHASGDAKQRVAFRCCKKKASQENVAGKLCSRVLLEASWELLGRQNGTNGNRDTNGKTN
jgi:hypothetical protein